MFVLILIVTANTHVSITTADFDSSAACLKAINTALDLEDREVKIKARCVQK